MIKVEDIESLDNIRQNSNKQYITLNSAIGSQKPAIYCKNEINCKEDLKFLIDNYLSQMPHKNIVINVVVKNESLNYHFLPTDLSA